MARTKAAVKRLPVKTSACLNEWSIESTARKKLKLFVQDKGDPTRTEDRKHNKKWTNSKSNKI